MQKTPRSKSKGLHSRTSSSGTLYRYNMIGSARTSQRPSVRPEQQHLGKKIPDVKESSNIQHYLSRNSLDTD